MPSRFHRLVTGSALAWLASSCTVVSAPPPQSPPPQSPPPAAAQPHAEYPADHPDSYPPDSPPEQPADYPEQPASQPEQPASYPPDRAPDDGAGDYRPPAGGGASIAPGEPPPPPRRRDHRTPTAEAPPPPPPRQDRRVPVRGRRPVLDFQIEPTAGPVGTTVIIYGDFRRAMQRGTMLVGFAGVRRPVRPLYVATDRLAVVVPRRARTGAVQVLLNRRELWNGSFAVTQRDDDIFIPIEGGNGLLGAVYKLPANTRRLPDFDALGRPHATIVVPALRVGARRFETGFPGLDATGEPLFEWFGIRFMGLIHVPRAGRYDFRINSDDGARLYIDNQLVLDNDGVHAPRAREGSIDLTAGKHDIVVEYFQGPRFQIALELFWRQSGRWVHVPGEALSRHSGYDCSSEPEIVCCQGNSAACRSCRQDARETLREWKQSCRHGGRPGAGNPSTGHPGTPVVDCARPPQRMCCQGRSAQCTRCRRQAAAERAEWQQQCGGGRPGAGNPNTGNPGTPVVDCARPPQRMCCQANTRQCSQCRQQAATERAEWQQQCGGGRPGAGNPGAPAVDCSRKPERMCCQGQAPRCVQCRQQAAEEEAAWKQNCVTTLPVEERVDCSQEPRIQPCCKALTPRCRECQRQARAQRADWERQCGRR